MLLDGRRLAATLGHHLREGVSTFKGLHGFPPRLILLHVKGAPGEAYVESKCKQAHSLGLHAERITLPPDTHAITSTLHTLNERQDVHGILLQLPLPSHLPHTSLLRLIAPHKDVDGLTPHNVALLHSGRCDSLLPCTPLGCMSLASQALSSLEGVHACVLGRSDLVGRPMALLLLACHATVTVCHGRTPPDQRAALLSMSDLVVSAMGRPLSVLASSLKEGAVVVDVGLSSTPHGLKGDINTEGAHQLGAFTPVPGGVGPMTIIMLMYNTLKAAYLCTRLPFPSHLQNIWRRRYL